MNPIIELKAQIFDVLREMETVKQRFEQLDQQRAILVSKLVQLEEAARKELETNGGNVASE